MIEKPIVIDLHYLPCIEYMSVLYHAKEVIIEKNEHFTKQSYRNRCRINGVNKIESLTIPVKHKKGKKIDDVEIDHDQKWLGVHLHAIRSAYGKAPFFEYFYEEIEEIFRKRHCKLFDFNLELLTKCLEILRLSKKIKFTDSFDKLIKIDQIDLRGHIHPKNSVNERTKYLPFEYPQVFGKNFVKNLSVIDLIFSSANSAEEVLNNSLEIKNFEKNYHSCNKK